MIIVGVGIDDFIKKLENEVKAIDEELSSFDDVMTVILQFQRKELVKYKLLGFKTKPPEGKKLLDEPPVKAYSTLITLSQELEMEYSRKMKEFREELQNLISTLESMREEYSDAIFILVTHGAKIMGVYIITPKTPGFESLKERLRR